ncbi:uncharacterized protein C8A04DRAFT_37892 [Dichotomopilus funicola]|uniref:Uncharacterized protein n=1 Tax=Dichotomopilus funicola TaxID=1934379 RepID=A0AAN6V180_9PEZI|nr:hypothetical protein C8A04DRAFT_37892 [Dichotomopilus funicola]
MTDINPDLDRPESQGYRASPVPPSPRPSVASRASGSSLRRDQERQDAIAPHIRPTSVTYSRPETPQKLAAQPVDGPPVQPSQQAQQQKHHPQQPQPFAPVFALLDSVSHSSKRQTVHYPTVHYIFADDDPGILSAALARHHNGSNSSGGGGGGSRPADRGVILDMEPSPDGLGYEVKWASSLTPDWAVTSAQVSQIEGDAGGGGRGGVGVTGLGGNLVLRVEGVSLEPESSSGLPVKASTSEVDLQGFGVSLRRELQQHRDGATPGGYTGLLNEFEKGMSTLRKVVEAATARQRVLGDGDGQFLEGTKRGTVHRPPAESEAEGGRLRDGRLEGV